MNDLLEIDKLYSTIFDDVQSFYKYYKSSLTEKTAIQWGNEFKSQLKIINEYLKAALVGNIRADQINLWFSRVRNWNENIKTIKYRIDDDIMSYEAHHDILPEGYYPSEMIEYKMLESGKTYENVSDVLKKQIELHISQVKEIQSHINESNTVADFAFIKMRTRYRAVLLPDLLTIPKLHFSTNIATKKEEELTPSIPEVILPPFETSSLNKIKISTISEKLSSGISPFIANTGTEFKLLFGGPTPPSVVIDWRRAKNQLHYFIDLLYDHKIIDESDANRWEKTSSFFTIQGERVTPDELKSANRLVAKAKKKEIESLFH